MLPVGEHSLPLPTGFIREDDDNKLHITDPNSNLPRYLRPRRYNDAVAEVMAVQRPDQPQQAFFAPIVYVIRKTTVDFVSFADKQYNLIWNYYKADDVLSTDIENLWLANAPEWLIGEAGGRMAFDTRDSDAKALFDDMAQKGRAAIFGNILADEDALGPLVMGGRL